MSTDLSLYEDIAVEAGYNIDLSLTQPQLDYLNCCSKFPAFVAGYGTGKSQIMCVSAIFDSMEGGNDSIVAIYEPTYGLVRDVAMSRMIKLLTEWKIPFKVNKNENRITTLTDQMGDFVFRSMDNPESIIGFESFRSKVDELDTLPMEKAKLVWEKIMGRNRYVPSTYQKMTDKPVNTIGVFTTPEGFKFVHKMWDQNDDNDYSLVKASTFSNPYNLDDWIEGLIKSYPPQLIKAYLFGEFVNLTSGSVYDQFDRVLNHSDLTIADSLDKVLHVGMDFNKNQGSAVIHIIDREGNPHAVDEVMGTKSTFEMAEILAERYKGYKLWVYPDASGATVQRNMTQSDHAIISKANNVQRIISDPSNPAVKDRINTMNGMFYNGFKERRYKVNTTTCQKYTKCLEQQCWDAKTGEPDKKNNLDHGPDAGGYFITKQYKIRRDFREIKIGT